MKRAKSSPLQGLIESLLRGSAPQALARVEGVKRCVCEPSRSQPEEERSRPSRKRNQMLKPLEEPPFRMGLLPVWPPESRREAEMSMMRNRSKRRAEDTRTLWSCRRNRIPSWLQSINSVMFIVLCLMSSSSVRAHDDTFFQDEGGYHNILGIQYILNFQPCQTPSCFHKTSTWPARGPCIRPLRPNSEPSRIPTFSRATF